MSGKRRGSVTRLLQDAPEYYSPPSPSDCPEPEDDCWDDIRPRPRRAPKRAAEVKKSEEDSAADSKKEKDAAQKAAQPKADTPSAALGLILSNPFNKVEPKKPVAGHGITDPKKKTAKDAKKQADGKGASPEDGDETPPPKPVFMHGCSAAYQRAVEHVRGLTVVPSIVVLGLPESAEENDMSDTSSNQMDRSSFVAMAASRLKIKGVKTEDKESNSDAMSDGNVFSQDLRKEDKSQAGKKFFEDAYISTWSHSILPADESLFAITFNTQEKPPPRTHRLSRPRLPREESSQMDASEWSDWRNVNDRVDQWLKDNARTEPDESHLLAILQDLDTRKGVLYR